MTKLSLRKFAVVATAGALLLSGIAVPASARGPKAGRGHGVEMSTKAPKGERGKSADAKARKAARFVATGTVVAVGADSLTLTVEGGTKSLRGTDATISVPADVRVNRDDVTVTLAEVQPGDHAAVQGAVTGGVLVAHRVNAESPEPIVEEPTETVTEDPTETISEQPTETISEQPTETISEQPTETVTDEPTETVTDQPVVP